MQIAESLGCTLDELGRRMSAGEYQLWRARATLTDKDFEPPQRELTVDEQIAQMKRVLN